MQAYKVEVIEAIIKAVDKETRAHIRLNRFLSELLPFMICCLPCTFCIFMQRYLTAFLCFVVQALCRYVFFRDKPGVAANIVPILISLFLFLVIPLGSFSYSFIMVCTVAYFACGIINILCNGTALYRTFFSGYEACMKARPDTSIADIIRENTRSGSPVSKLSLKTSIAAVILLINVFFCMADPHISGVTGTGDFSQRASHVEYYSEDMYVSYEGGVMLAKWQGTDTTVVIPDTVAGKKVIAIGPGAFKDSNIIEIVLPDTVSTIALYAFSGCQSLISVTLPEGIAELKEGIFFGCSALKNINIPDSVTKIHARAFYGCSALRSVVLPDRLETINAYAFANCSSLSDINLPASLNEVGAAAFAHTDLRQVIIPDNITKIHAMCFSNCYSLESVSLPDSLSEIGEYAFRDCTALSSIELSDKLTSIGPYAFSNSGLTDITIPGSIRAIKEYCFYACKSLITVTIKPGVTRVGAHAFQDCSSLQTVSCPWTMKVFRASAFRSCGHIQISYPWYTCVGERVFKDTLYQRLHDNRGTDYENIYSSVVCSDHELQYALQLLLSWRGYA